MIALDTNILTRLILRDDKAQFRKARALLAYRFEQLIDGTAAPSGSLPRE